ncbi:molecular chaperone [Pseudomonas fluorescens]|uniref:Molecular chaperone n=2 Tax=Pseudomonas fluorescens TaxID=294 RepID=A0A7Z6MQS7_PSEFL|nr:molecular chaperone [Pseudomonas fluorescens]
MRIYRLLIGCLLIYLMSFDARANIVLGGTRLIYPGGEREVTLPLSNKGATPALVQSWMDDGATDSTPENSSAPFLIMPPLTRIEGQASQTLRILFNGTALPPDRESLFWLNVLEVPPVPEKSRNKNNLLLAVQSRIKVFYRPATLRSSLHDAAKHLKWQVFGDGAQLKLRCTNTSPLHVSFADIQVKWAGKTLSNTDGNHMVAPGGEAVFELHPQTARLPELKAQGIQFNYINDYGALKTVNAQFD